MLLLHYTFIVMVKDLRFLTFSKKLIMPFIHIFDFLLFVQIENIITFRNIINVHFIYGIIMCI